MSTCIDLQKLAELCAKATPQNLTTAETHEEGETLACPFCNGDGDVDAETFENYDGAAIGVQFYGVGDEHVAAHELWKALDPQTVQALLAVVKAAQVAVADKGIPWPPASMVAPEYAGPMNHLAEALSAFQEHP